MRKLHFKRTALTLVVGAICASAGVAVQAEGLMLEEVIVTAQKSAESLQDVSVSVSNISANFSKSE